MTHTIELEEAQQTVFAKDLAFRSAAYTKYLVELRAKKTDLTWPEWRDAQVKPAKTKRASTAINTNLAPIGKKAKK